MEKTTRGTRSRGKYENQHKPAAAGRSRTGTGQEKSRPARQKSGGANFIVQGSILAAAGIIVRLIGMLYRIPLANYIGDEGNGYYSAAYNIYSILLILSSYSLPVAVSKMVSARLAKNQYRSWSGIWRAVVWSRIFC